MPSPYVMSPAEIEILEAGATNPTLVLDYFMRRPGAEHGWRFDYNFSERGKWQLEMCQASQTFIVCVAGIGTGKTLAVGMAALTHAMLTPDFKFLNIAREAWQSQLMYSYILEWAQGSLMDAIIIGHPKRPYPMIVVEYMLNGILVRSTLEFMSIGEKEDAANIFSWRGDWINIDEAGRLDNLGEVVANLSTRGTGSTPGGRPYLGRLSLTSNAWDNADMWILFDTAVADPDNCLAINVNTEDNHNVTKKQVDQILRINRMTIGSDEVDRYLTGNRPEGRGSYFNREVVDRCSSRALTSVYLSESKVFPDKYNIQILPALGCYFLETPPQPGRIYFMMGDPGTGAPPARNAYVIMVFDVTDFPTSASNLVALSWGNGGGSITPFINQVMDWIRLYHPLYAGVDSTGPQRGTAEVVSIEKIFGKGFSVQELTPMDFSGSKKQAYLVALRPTLESSLMLWPHMCSGIGSQLKNYDPNVDRANTSKLPQDLVATLAMVAWALRAHFGVLGAEEGSDASTQGTEIVHPGRYNRNESTTWSSRSRRSDAGRSQSAPRTEKPEQ